MNTTFGSPNYVPSTLSALLRRLANDNRTQDDERIVGENGLVAIILGITALDAFANLFFRALADEVSFQHIRDKLIKDLEKPVPLSAKLEKWCRRAFGKTPDHTDSRWKSFIALRNWRNELVHFKSSPHALAGSQTVAISGLADIAALTRIRRSTPQDVLGTMCGIEEMIGELRGYGETEKSGFVHLWIGVIGWRSK